MKFDNGSTIIGIQMKKRLYAVIVAVVIGLLFTTLLHKYVTDFTGLSRGIIAIILVVLYVGYNVYYGLKRTTFISYNDETSRIVVRHYRLRMFDPPKNSYEIPKEQFLKYELQRDKLGLWEELTLYRVTGQKVAKYPSFSISTLSKEQRKNLLGSLDFFKLEK
ncbi:MAG: hypothetical protein JW783_10635 [Bacteroidales bacterium]|nr:hypothetical protein [Bacteroidales bacterium]MBN2749790.1 hypothetical protein [Bacteroidales bacterium]